MVYPILKVEFGSMTNMYKFNDETLQKKYEELLGNNPPDSLENEAALLTTLINHHMANEGEHLVASLVKTKMALHKQIEDSQYKRGELLGRTALLEYTAKVVHLICDNIKDYEGWEQRVDNIVNGIITIISDIRNPANEKMKYIKQDCNEKE